MYDEFLRKRLFQLRRKKGVSARAMSLDIGQGRNYIIQIENNQALPSMMGFFYICEYLDVHPKEFFDDEIGNPTLTKELIRELGGLSDEQLKNILGIVKGLKR